MLPRSRTHALDRGVPIFLVLTLTLAGAAAAWLDASWIHAASDAPTRLLRASLIYAAVLGLPPLLAALVATRGRLGAAVKSPRAPRGVRSAVRWGWIAVAGAAVFLAALIGPSASAPGEPGLPTEGDALHALRAFGITVVVLWGQALAEELTWRGYVLPRLVAELGTWRALIVHAIVWGLSYAVVVAALGGTSVRAGEMIASCTLLGVALGWVRLASNGVLAGAGANALLSLGGGLPLVLVGLSPPTGAVFGPAGWVLLILIALIVGVQARRAP